MGVKNVGVLNTTIRGTSDRAVYAGRSARLDSVIITGNATHAVTAALNAIIERSSIMENGGTGWPSTGELHKTSAVVFASRIRLSESTVHSNAWAGMEADRIRVRDSAVFGNGTFPECGVTLNCKFDIGSSRPVRFENSSCDVSLDMESCGCDGDSQVNAQTDPALHNWGICAND